MRTQVKLHKKATVTLCRRFIPTKPDRCDDKPTQLDTVTKSALAHLTDNSHGIPDHRRRAPAFQPPPQETATFGTGETTPNWSCVPAFSCRSADLPQSRATSPLRLCNQNCTDSALHAHFSCSAPLCDLDRAFIAGNAAKNQRAKCGKRLLLMCTRRWVRTASFSYVAPTEHWRVTTAVPRSSQASRPPSGQARRCASVSGIYLFVPETDRGQCAHTPSSDLSPFEPWRAGRFIYFKKVTFKFQHMGRDRNKLTCEVETSELLLTCVYSVTRLTAVSLC